MKIALMYLTLIVGQAPLQQTPAVVHLRSHGNSIPFDFGGKLLELANAPTVVYLPNIVPKFDASGKPWAVMIKNNGPEKVGVAGTGEFKVLIEVGQTVLILSDGNSYSSRP